MKNLRVEFAKNVLAVRNVSRQTTEEMLNLAKETSSRISFAQKVLLTRAVTRQTTEEMLNQANNFSHLAQAV